MGSYTIVDTNQTSYYGNTTTISTPASNASFYGQDAGYQGKQPSYVDNGNSTVTDLNTGLTWMKSTTSQEMTWAQAVSYASTAVIGGYSDWRLPTIKELYSLIEFSGYTGTSASTSSPYLDTRYFNFSYGDTSAGERVIDAQEWSSTRYVSTTMSGDPTAFGVNFADGRIKGYPISIGSTTQTMDVRLVRGNTSYGQNAYVDNGNGTITDNATGLMWLQADSGSAMSWQDALAYAEASTASGYSDWRLPNAKELQSIVDYTRSPDTTGTAAIDPLFKATNIGTSSAPEYGFYWTGTSHVENGSGDYAVYVAFGRALGWMQQKDGSYKLMDVHGAGAQRSDPKTGNASDYPHGFGPQGDVIRINNMVRLVRDASSTSSDNTNQSFTGTSGNDSFTGGTGNDTIDGGAGIDTAVFSNKIADYTRSKSGSVWTIKANTGTDGTDTVSNVERLHFSDGNVALDTDGTAGQAYRLYRAAFAREPDSGGVGYWMAQMDKGMSLATAASSFIASSEFQARYGSAPSNGDLLTKLYSNVLGRAADQSGYDWWLTQMNNGLSKTNVLVEFAQSAENQSAVATLIGSTGFAYTEWLG